MENQDKPQQGRKRKCQEPNTEELNTNQSQFGSRGEFLVPKKFIPVICGCRLKCHDACDQEVQAIAFNNYQAIRTFEGRICFILSCVGECEAKSRLKVAGVKSRRSFTRSYQIDGIRVCKPFFLGVLQISHSAIDGAFKKLRVMEFRDFRGKRSKKKENQDEMPQVLKEFVPFDCGCNWMCSDICDPTTQVETFNKYHSSESHEDRTCFILSSVGLAKPVKRKSSVDNNNVSRKTITRTYHINHVRVCQKFYLGVLQITHTVVDAAFKKCKKTDQRDKQKRSQKKEVEDLVEVKSENSDFEAEPYQIMDYNEPKVEQEIQTEPLNAEEFQALIEKSRKPKVDESKITSDADYQEMLNRLGTNLRKVDDL